MSSVDKTMSPSVEVQQVLETVKYVYLKYPKLVGYPAWYCDLCHKSSSGNTVRDGPTLISTQMQVI